MFTKYQQYTHLQTWQLLFSVIATWRYVRTRSGYDQDDGGVHQGCCCCTTRFSRKIVWKIIRTQLHPKAEWSKNEYYFFTESSWKTVAATPETNVDYYRAPSQVYTSINCWLSVNGDGSGSHGVGFGSTRENRHAQYPHYVAWSYLAHQLCP